MKFKFTKDLPYQLDAINAVVDVFDTGKNIAQNRVGESVFALRSLSSVVGNELEIDEARILKNVQAIQEQNGIEEKSITLGSLDFSIEMETGTGKTYVYLRTAMELCRRYGLKKFIILVPSVAIREGVLKTIKQTTEHFNEIYNFRFGSFAYDSGKLSQVRNDFVQSPDMQIMVMTIQSFNKDSNILRQSDRDDTHGEAYLDLIAQTRPVVIMDEPQNMESELSKSAIDALRPLFKLRYSATHKEKHNLMYRLTPIDAYRQSLVKRIEIYGVKESDPNAFVFQVVGITAKKGQSPTAKVMLEIKQQDEYVIKETLITGGEDVLRKSKGNDKYKGLMVSEIDAKNKRIELSDGKLYPLEAEVSEDKESIFRTQIRETIKAHIEKQNDLGTRLKVLSLFFIDRVDNYVHEGSLIRTIFEEEFVQQQAHSERFKDLSVQAVHNGYFAKKVIKGVVEYKETRGDSKDDKDVYDLIMKDKERLLSLGEPISFIFTHTALKEGWDNPNVFQICTLNETRSTMKKRQEIGRGLRLPVDTEGNRVFDDRINILTVIANESYKEFVGSLQQEYDEAGYKGAPSAGNARARVNVVFKKNLPVESEDFKNLWEQIRRKTRFNIEVKTEKLVESALEKINQLSVGNLVVRVDKVIVDFDKDGKMKTVYENAAFGDQLDRALVIGDIIGRIERETGITRRTAYEIISKAETLNQLFASPEEYIRSVIVYIKHSLNDLLINEGLKYFPVEDVWEVELFEDFQGYKKDTIKSEKSVYSHVMFDSDGEREFAENLEKSTRVTLFAKLPSRFVVDTPLGTYNPDWAIVMKNDDGTQKLYLVRETKFVTALENLRPEEQQKIKCGIKHFAALGVDFDITQQKDLTDLIKS